MITSRDKSGRITEASGQPRKAVDFSTITKLYQNGLSISQTAKLIGCSYSVIHLRLTELGLCRDKGCGNRDRKFPPSHRKAISKGLKKLFTNPQAKEQLRVGSNNGFYGKHHKPETIKAMKEKLSILLSGENNPQWLGGLSFEPYGLEFSDKLKEVIREQDNHQCQICGVPELELIYKLIVHHIDYNKQHNNPSNLTSLCRPCHMKTNFERKDWILYFQSKEVILTL